MSTADFFFRGVDFVFWGLSTEEVKGMSNAVFLFDIGYCGTFFGAISKTFL